MEPPQSNTQIPVYTYTRTELLSLRTTTSLLSLSTVDRLKDLNIGYHLPHIEHIGRLARMSVLDTEVDGSNPGSSMLFP